MNQMTSALCNPTPLQECGNSHRLLTPPIAAAQRPDRCAPNTELDARRDRQEKGTKARQLNARETIQRLVAARTLALPAWLREAENSDASIDGENWIVEHQFNEADRALNGRRYTARRQALKWLDALGKAALNSQSADDIDAVHDLVNFLGAATYRTAHFGPNEIASACVFLPPPSEFTDCGSYHNFNRAPHIGFAAADRSIDARHYGFGVMHDGSMLVDIVPKAIRSQSNASSAIRSAPSHAAVWKILDAIGQWEVSESSAIVSPLPRSVASFGASPRNPYSDDWIAALSLLLRNRRSNFEQLGLNYRHVKRWTTQILRANLSVNIFRELHEALDRRLLNAMCHTPAVLSVAGYNTLCVGDEKDMTSISWQMLFEAPLTISMTLERAAFDKASLRVGYPSSWRAVTDRTNGRSESGHTLVPETSYTAVFAASLTSFDEGDTRTSERAISGPQP